MCCKVQLLTVSRSVADVRVSGKQAEWVWCSVLQALVLSLEKQPSKVGTVQRMASMSLLQSLEVSPRSACWILTCVSTQLLLVGCLCFLLNQSKLHLSTKTWKHDKYLKTRSLWKHIWICWNTKYLSYFQAPSRVGTYREALVATFSWPAPLLWLGPFLSRPFRQDRHQEECAGTRRF